MSSEIPVVAATAEALDAASETLAISFHDSPWTRWTLPEEDHIERLAALQRHCLGHASEHGSVFVVSDDTPAEERGLHFDATRPPVPIGVAAILPADAPEPASEITEAILALHGGRADRLASVAGPELPAGTWILETLGVLPEHRGRGVGSALLVETLLSLASRAGDRPPVALDTSDPRNLDLYRRYGFEVTRHLQVDAGVERWSMLRMP